MKKPDAGVSLLALIIFAVGVGQSSAQSLLNESGTSILAPTLAPTGGYAANPQEYLTVQWSVVEDPSSVYTYSYTVMNPAGDVLLTPTGDLTTTSEILNTFSVDFDTTTAGAYLPGTQAGGVFREVNTIDLAWFFNPSVVAGSSSPMVSFQSDLPPVFANANAQDGAPPSPWSSVSAGGQQLPVPNAVPEPDEIALFLIGGGFLSVPLKRLLKTGKHTIPA